ncbi:MAG: hypothetical protein ACI9HE_002598 [Planctomycetota bacterium]|jgi:hypothetical protein
MHSSHRFEFRLMSIGRVRLNYAPPGAWVLSVEGQPPLPINIATRVLLDALGHLAKERGDVREALYSVQTWIGEQLGNSGPLHEKVVSPEVGRRVVTDNGRTEDRAHREARRIDMAKVEARSRWKEAALRFVVERRSADEDLSEQLATRERELRDERTNHEETYPWMLEDCGSGNDEALLDAADCYDVVATVASRIAELQSTGALDEGAPSELLYLIAEAQSALLAALSQVGQRTDSDQRDLFLWLKDQTHRHRIYVDRHMRLEDPADAKGSADRLRRLGERVELVNAGALATRERGKLLNKLRFHTRKCLESQRILEGDATTLTATLLHWKELGLGLDDRSVVELVGPLESLADGALGELLAEINSGECSFPKESGEDAVAPRRSSTDEARQLLADQNALAFELEGECDVKALSEGLGLAKLEVVAVPEAPTEEQLVAWIDGNEGKLVLLGRRLDEDAYEVFKRICLERGRLFVRLPDGFEPAHVARQVIRQVGWRLRPQAATRASD